MSTRPSISHGNFPGGTGEATGKVWIVQRISMRTRMRVKRIGDPQFVRRAELAVIGEEFRNGVQTPSPDSEFMSLTFRHTSLAVFNNDLPVIGYARTQIGHFSKCSLKCWNYSVWRQLVGFVCVGI